MKKKKKQGIKNFFKPVSNNSNVAKETNAVETATSVEVPSKSLKSTKTEIVNEKPVSLSVSMLLLLQTYSRNQRTTQNVCLESSPKKTCRIIITNFLFSFSIYLLSLSLYTKTFI